MRFFQSSFKSSLRRETGPCPYLKSLSIALSLTKPHSSFNVLAKAATQVTRPWARLDYFCARKLPPARHVLVRGRSAEIEDHIQLMAITLAGQDGLAPEHLAKYTSAPLISDCFESPQKQEDSPDTPHVNSSGVLLQV